MRGFNESIKYNLDIKVNGNKKKSRQEKNPFCITQKVQESKENDGMATSMI